MDNFGLPNSPLFERTIFNGVNVNLTDQWQSYNVPRGKSFLSIFMVGGGGGGGSGVVGANSVSAGGGGGGSGGQTVIEIPIILLPPRLYVFVGVSKTLSGSASYVSSQTQASTGNTTVGIAGGGGGGGNATAGTGGAAGTAAGVATAGTMPLGWAFSRQALAGQAGIIGGAAIAGAALVHPLTGLRVTGGVGGGGLPAAAANGTNGGGITAIAAPSYFHGQSGGVGSATATNRADNGRAGSSYTEAGFYHIGGTGGASTHGTATGGGLVQASGGDGSIGSGGGGMGGALTGSTAGALSRGGAGIVIITAY